MNFKAFKTIISGLTMIICSMLILLCFLEVSENLNEREQLNAYQDNSLRVEKDFADKCIKQAQSEGNKYALNDIEAYCNNFKYIAKEVVNSYGGEDIKVVLIDDVYTCGGEAVACVIEGEPIIHLNPEIFSYKSYLYEDNLTLKSVIAHEYVHALTSSEEFNWLHKNEYRFTNKNDITAREVVADCGIRYFLGDNHYTAYIDKEQCVGEWQEITNAVIEDTLVK